MATQHPLDEDVEAYACLAVQLATAEAGQRDAMLQQHELDEAGYDALESRWLEKISRAEEAEEGDGVPPLLLAYANAFARAQRATSGDGVVPFERYVMITRGLSRGRDVAQVLDKQNLSLGQYLRAHQHWTTQLAGDPALALRFRRLMRQ